MSKLKKFFGAGDQQDDEIMYGAEPKKKSQDESSERIDSDPARDEKEYGSTAAVSATGESKASTTEISPSKSEDGDESKSKGLLSKILPSKKDKESEEFPESSSKDNRAFETAAGTTAGGATGAVAAREESKSKDTETDREETKKSKGLLSKIIPSKSDKKAEEPAESTATATTAAERPTAEPTAHDSELGQGAVIAGAGAAGAAGIRAAAYESHEHDSNPQQSSLKDSSAADSSLRKNTGDDVAKATYTERSYQLAGGSASDATAGATTADDSHLGRDAAIAGGAAGIAGLGAYAATRSNDEVTPDTRAQDIQNPEQVDTSSRLSPHVPGEFPTEDGRDPHATSLTTTSAADSAPQADRGIGTGAAVGAVGALGAGGAATSAYKEDGGAPIHQGTSYYGRPPASPPATQTEFASTAGQEHHYGRDAALAGAGATAIGGGTYAATRHEDQTPVISNTAGSTTTTNKYDEQRATAPNVTGPTTTTTPHPAEQQHHYGRDAAVAGGAGAAGLAATEAWKEHEKDTGPAPNTIGPHDSDVKNVVDPRVQPDSSQQKKESSSSGPHKSDIANKLDPRVKDSTPSETREDTGPPEHGRDAAVVAATTAMASSRDEDSANKDNRVSTDDRGHHHLHKKNEERTGEKKPGFISKLLHRDQNKKEDEEPSGEGSHFAGAGAAREIETQNTPTSGANTTGLPVGDDGMIHIVKEGSHPDDPHMVIAGDGSEVFKDRE